MLEIVKYREPLNREELSFLRRKEERERKQFYKLVKVFMILSFVFPFLIAWSRALSGAENPFSVGTYFLGVLVLLVFSGIGIYLFFHINLYKLQKDLRNGTKTIERTFITRKQYMAMNHTYFFYISSPTRLSIEVNESDYHSLSKGDEVNIEYTTYSQMYLGYF